MFGRSLRVLLKKKEEPKKKVFVDLEGYPSSSAPKPQSDASVKYVDILAYTDLKPIVDLAYRGNIVILDFSRYADGEQSKRDISEHLAGVATDTDGKFREVSDRLMIITPGWNIEHIRITHKER
ncbi:MAG: cell division protein SepF [Candidatus Methanoplasma sp.]|jgi:SepF-like predicted cell division protein (DUF552 family)|nr:cell division protein SepF [Candidatus Methanoplasma sp.]